jgi:YidC/Oxa1 family membrane protein insertase
MFDPFLRAIAQALAFFYSLPVVGGSYGFAIMLLTLAVMILLMPLTLRATRSTIKMQAVQPEMKRLQKKYKDDREQLNAELMKLYQENGINPVGGCLPVLAQAPVFIVLFQVLRGVTRRISDSPFYEAANVIHERRGEVVATGNEINPRFLDTDSDMYRDLFGSTEMKFGPFDLAQQAWDVLQSDVLTGLPYVVMILFLVGTSYYQQKQVSARRGNDASPMNAQQQMLLRFLPVLTGFWSFIFPAGLVLYWVTSNLFRIGQQAYITRQIYGREMAAGKHDLPKLKDRPDDDDEPPAKAKVKSGAGSKPTAGKAAKRGSSGGAKSGSSKSKAGERDAEWRKLRAQKQAKRSANKSQGSSRTTPKGTQARPQSKKRKR